ncbi:DUF2164 domain-containing protein [Virgibacillus sp. MSP4-1]|uniref:DUF2164 domain-containing protein n=1 Tax=Virgibacillus sp. MSP4-1 TaxID=2700081 RepID=UPI0003A6B48C|nr:DUF2164 domain-containing protein [Virgibacillus sp. MSP4-1]QHS22475.1 DUF2164 domain-containing protein [Virgibacillus sp. MSP4-1]
MKISLEKKRVLIRKIQMFFLEERGEEIGELAADQAFEFIKNEVAPFFYNQGVHDARMMAEQNMEALDEDIRSLEKPTHRGG